MDKTRNKIWQTIKTKRFLCGLLTAILVNSFGIASFCFLKWIIPWRWLGVMTWIITYYPLFFYTVLHWDEWYDRYCNNKYILKRRK